MSEFRRLDNRDRQAIEQKYSLYFASKKKNRIGRLRWTLLWRMCMIGLIAAAMCVPNLVGALDARVWQCNTAVQDPESAVLADTINPNHAPWFVMVTLPDIGPSRAHAIVSYRENAIESNPQQPVFQSLLDLDNVPSIGPVTLESCRPYISFKP